MKKIMGLSLLIITNAMGQVPSDLKRQEIKIEKGEVNLHRAHISIEAGNSSSQSNTQDYSVSPYRGTDLTLKAGTKFIQKDSSFGHAFAPDAKIKIRLDERNKKMRFEIGGNVFSVVDLQVIKGAMTAIEENFYKANIHILKDKIAKKEKEIAELEKESANNLKGANEYYKQTIPEDVYGTAWLKRPKGWGNTPAEYLEWLAQYKNPLLSLNKLSLIALAEKSRSKLLECRHKGKNLDNEGKEWCKNKFSELLKDEENLVKEGLSLHQETMSKAMLDTLNELKTNLEKFEQALELDQKSKPYATFALSGLNLGALHQDLSDALYKFSGFRGSILNVSFDVDSKIKNTDMRIGLCGIFEVVTMQAGKFTQKENEYFDVRGGFTGSLCGRVRIGQVVVTNTFSSQIQHGHNKADYSISNDARVAYQSKVIPGAITEFGVGHTYTHEKIGDTKINTNIIGGGITVLAK